MKKILSIVLSVMMIMSTLVILPLSVGAEPEQLPEAWDGETTDTSWASAEGTEADPYKIGTAAALAGLSAATNDTDAPLNLDGKYVELTADINLGGESFAPIVAGTLVTGTYGSGEAETTYIKTITGAMHFDGKNFTIYGLNVVAGENGGLFTTLGCGTTVKNVKFVGAAISGGSVGGSIGDGGAIGIVAGRIGSNVTIENVSTDSTSSVRGVAIGEDCVYTGGIVGYADDLSNTEGMIVFRNVFNAASVRGVEYAGGMVGRLGAYNDALFEYCANVGTIDCISTAEEDCSDASSGGIIGELRHISEDDRSARYNFAMKVDFTTTLENCYNTGTLKAETTAPRYAGVAGMVGRQWGQDGSFFVARNCYDYSYREIRGTAQNLNTGIMGNGRADVWTDLEYCYALNAPDADGNYGTAYADFYKPRSNDILNNPDYEGCYEIVSSGLLESIVDEIVTDGEGTTSTMFAEINAINTLLGVPQMVVEGVAEPDPEADYSWYTANGGTKDAPYEIANAAQWSALVLLSTGKHDRTVSETALDLDGKYIKLTGDLDFNGYHYVRPLGGDYPEIHLDGNNKVVMNLEMSTAGVAGLIGKIGNGSEIKNLSIEACSFAGVTDTAALVVESKADVTFYNCKVLETTVLSRSRYAAGILAFMNDNVTTEGLTRFSYCVNEATVNGHASVAGIVAHCVSRIHAKYEYCANKGTLTSDATTNTQQMGGIVGYFAGSASEKVLVFNHCYNTGSLNVAITGKDIYVMVAGIVGRHLDNELSEMYMVNCFDLSARDVTITDGNKGQGTTGLLSQGYKSSYRMYYHCYGANAVDSTTVYSSITTWEGDPSCDLTQCFVMDAADDPIINYQGESSTIEDEIAKIDDAIENLTRMDTPGFTDIPELDNDDATGGDTTGGNTTGGNTTGGNTTGGNTSGGNTSGGNTSGGNTAGGNETTAPETTAPETTAPETTAPETTGGDETTDAPAEEGGCASSVTATFAVVAATAVAGFAFVAKKKDEE